MQCDLCVGVNTSKRCCKYAAPIFIQLWNKIFKIKSVEHSFEFHVKMDDSVICALDGHFIRYTSLLPF